MTFKNSFKKIYVTRQNFILLASTVISLLNSIVVWWSVPLQYVAKYETTHLWQLMHASLLNRETRSIRSVRLCWEMQNWQHNLLTRCSVRIYVWLKFTNTCPSYWIRFDFDISGWCVALFCDMLFLAWYIRPWYFQRRGYMWSDSVSQLCQKVSSLLHRSDTIWWKIVYVFWNLRILYPVIFIHFQVKARIRVQLSAAHSLQDVDRAVDAFISVGKDLKVIPWKVKVISNGLLVWRSR